MQRAIRTVVPTRLSLALCVCSLTGPWCFPATTEPAPPPTAGLYFHMAWSKPKEALKRAIPAARALGYDFLVLEIGGNVQLDAQSGRGAWTKDEVKELLSLAQANSLEVIPGASLLGHPECTPLMFKDRKLGLKLWEPGVYEFVEEYLAELCVLFGKPRYFHARMDESRKLIAKCSERLGVDPAKFLAGHIKRINEIVKRQGARLIIYHDMLLPKEQVGIGTALGGAPLNSWKAVDEIPRDVIINFWLYQFFSAHGYAVEFFTSRGFETWLSPWLTPEPMCKWAAEHKLPVIQTIWCNTTSLARYEANLRAMALGAVYRTDSSLPSRYKLPFDPLLKGTQALSHPQPKIEGAMTQLALGESDGTPQDLPKAIEFAGRQWQLSPIALHTVRATLDERLKGAKLPLKAIRADGAERTIDGVNRHRGERELILYTPAFGHHPNTNMFGGEASIVDGIVQERAPDVWSGSGLVIPPNGCVLSGFCGGDLPKFMSGIKTLDTIRVVDADGADLLSPAPDDSKLLEGVVVPTSSVAKAIWLIHATLNPIALRRSGSQTIRPLVGEVVAGTQRFPIRYRRHVGCLRVAR